MTNDWDTPPDGDFVRYIERLNAAAAAAAAAQLASPHGAAGAARSPAQASTPRAAKTATQVAPQGATHSAAASAAVRSPGQVTPEGEDRAKKIPSWNVLFWLGLLGVMFFKAWGLLLPLAAVAWALAPFNQGESASRRARNKAYRQRTQQAVQEAMRELKKQQQNQARRTR